MEMGHSARPLFPLSPLPTIGSTIADYGAVADYDGDGNLDLAVPDAANSSIDLYFGDGTGHFQSGKELQDFNRAYAVFAADVNNDGHKDLIVHDSISARTVIWLGDGKGDFTQQQTTYPQGAASCSLNTVADLNGDGNVDLICSDGLGNIDVMTGNGDGTFNAPQVLASGLETADRVFTATDLNGDGVPDLLTTDDAGFDTILSKGKLSYGPPQTRTAGSLVELELFTPLTAVADFNGDGVPDLAAAVSGGIQLFFGNAQGSYLDGTVHPLSNLSSSLFAGDFNGDGIADVVALSTSGVPETFLGTKSGVFSAPVQNGEVLPSGWNWIGDLVGDFDGDGKQDILLNGISSMDVLYGKGDGSFTPLSVSGPTINNGLAADLNKDGKTDAVGISPFQETSSGAFQYGLTALLGNSNRTFTQVVTNFPPETPGEGIVTPALLAVGDLNGDGYPDAVVFDPNADEVAVWLGTGNGGFTAGGIVNGSTLGVTPLGTGEQGIGIPIGAIADLDGDGHADVVFLASSAMVIEYGDGAGNFSQTQVIPLTHPFTSLALAALDQSGHLGMLIGDGQLISSIRNFGARQYGPEEFYTGGSFGGLLTADFNGDGYSDILVTRQNPMAIYNLNSTEFTVLLNEPDVTGGGADEATGSVSVSPSPVNYNQGFTLTASLVASVQGQPVPTGTISFVSSGVSLGNAPLVNGVATVQVPGTTTQTLASGEQLIEANYSGDSNYLSLDLTAEFTVLQPAYGTQTTLTLTALGAPVTTIQAGSFVTMNVSVTSNKTVPAGYIAIYDGAILLGQTQVTAGEATFSTNLLSIGSHSITAQYLGYSPAGASSFQSSVSTAAMLTVTGVTTTASLQASSQSVTAGSVLTLTTAVSSASGTPVGGVTFFDGATALGSLSLDTTGSTAFSTVTLAVGSHSLTAQYPANGVYAGSTTPAITVTVNAASGNLRQTSTLIAGLTPGSPGMQEAKIQVIDPENLGTRPKGMVSLIADGRLMTIAPLSSNGLASMPLNLSGSGMHKIYASFGGSTEFAPSASQSFQTTSYQTASDFTLKSDPLTNVANMAPLVIGAIGNWSGTVTLACVSGVPSGYACNFSPVVVVGTGQSTLTLQSTQPSNSFLKVALLLPCFIFLRAIHRRRSIALILLIGLVFTLSSCSDTSPSEVTSAAQVVTVEATSRSIVHSAQVSLKTRHLTPPRN